MQRKSMLIALHKFCKKIPKEKKSSQHDQKKYARTFTPILKKM